ncbi:N-acetylmuramoyl-L-alanine amidase, partial [Staphylococcus hyicus]
MVKKIGYKTPSIIALTIAGTAISAHHADAAENTTQATPNKVLDSQKALQQAEQAKTATTSQQTTVSGTKAYQDPSKVSTSNTTTTPAQPKQATSSVNKTTTQTATSASTQTSAVQPKDSHIQLHNEAQVSPEKYAQANSSTTAQMNNTQSTQASTQNNTKTAQSLSAQPQTYSAQASNTDINTNPNGPTPPRIGGKGGPATLSLNSNTSTGKTALRANAPTAYKPQVSSQINDYIRKQNYTVPKYEEDFSSYFPKYGYRNGVGKPEGIVVHDTANPNSTIDGEISYMKRNYQSAFVHGFINDQRIIETQPTDYLSWGAGPNANERFINIELVHVYGYDKFARQMNNFADYAATNLQYYNLRPNSAEYDGQGTVWTHDAVSRFLGGTDHTDPHGYLQSRGYSYNELYDLINEKYMIKMGLAAPAYSPGGSTTPSKPTPSTPSTTPSSPLTVNKDTGVGRIKTANSGLYTTVYDDAGKKTSATNQTFNVTKKASLNGNTFYLVSDYNTGSNLGWVKQSDVDYRTSQPAVKISKNFTIPAGTTLYNVPWGTNAQVAGAVKGTGAQAFKATQQ